MQESHTCQVFFFLRNLQDHGLLNPEILLPWQRDVTTSLKLQEDLHTLTLNER